MYYKIIRTGKEWKRVIVRDDIKDNCSYALILTNGSFIDFVKLLILTKIPRTLKRRYEADWIA